MLNRAKQSVLARAVIDWKHIRGGIDLETFFPGPRECARLELSLEPADTLLLYVASYGSSNPYKDFETVRQSLEHLHRQQPARRVTLIVIGSSAPDEHLGPHILIRHAGFIESRPRLASFYRAADVVVHSAIEETFGNVVAEAAACGAPIVLASGGGVLELIEDGSSGLVVPPRQPARLAAAIRQLLEAPDLRARLGAAAAIAARRNLDGRAMIRNLESWCAEVYSAWHSQPAG